jgi:hypothetical protein
MLMSPKGRNRYSSHKSPLTEEPNLAIPGGVSVSIYPDSISVSMPGSVYNFKEMPNDSFTDAETTLSPDDDRGSVSRSQAGFFRDAAKYGWGEDNIVDPPSPEITKQTETSSRTPKGQEQKTKISSLILLEKLLEEIDSVTLQADEGKAVDLEERKIIARQLIQDICEAAKKYVRSIHEVERAARMESLDTRDYQQVVEDSDRRRRIVHDSLISKINIAKRYIATQFSGISDPQGFLPDWVNVNDRNSITDWAIGFVEELDSSVKSL